MTLEYFALFGRDVLEVSVILFTIDLQLSIFFSPLTRDRASYYVVESGGHVAFQPYLSPPLSLSLSLSFLSINYSEWR